MKDWLEIQFWKVAKWLIIRGYGSGCETSHIDETMFDNPDELRVYLKSGARCGSCRAKEIIEWIDEHINLLKA